ncbi:uroporphyrinogen-III C-methyltransferase [Acuticoccus kandeliae]|uniref:uroporphyrinogen-III C-methyltransferase n=1 Tax=Acuticoccus kandeliae TaxID=2073160 RepID=UPI000D3EDE1A|nr:uroporphyrinogen-III C-methyltransferase [Acuticoccus kandeliae]
MTPLRDPEPRSFADLDAAPFPVFAPGSVWLVGAGPGAPGLLTLMAYHALTHADLIVHDSLVGEAILGFARPGARLLHAGKRGGKPSASQADITETLIEAARAGDRVLRLKGGDPFMFGRGGEECQALAAAEIPFRIVPGISAGLGGLAYAGLPATHRDINQSVTFLTGHDLKGELPTAIDWPLLAKASPVLVMYMAAKHLTAIAARLLEAGRPPDEPVALIANATLPDQSLVRLTLAEAATPRPLPTPAIVVVGAAVTLADTISWFDAAESRGMMG